ncbi:MAG: alpha/beta hydrolase domain-containing protein, partial [Niameybacter sp.]
MSKNIRRKRFLAACLAGIMIGSCVPQAVLAKDYEGHWANNSISKWMDKGIIQGYEDGTFKPKNEVSRAELATILTNIFGLVDTSAAKEYKDVEKNTWYAEAIAKVSSYGLMNDYEDNFNPKAPATREEAAYAIAKAYKLTGESSQYFKDQEQISDWAEDEIASLVAGGYLSGRPGGTFAPKSILTRADIITMVDKITGEVINKPGTYAENIKGNLVINTKDVVLKNIEIEGNIYIAPGVQDGTITLENIMTKDDVFVEGSNSIIIKGKSTIGKIIISEQNKKVDITIEAGTTISGEKINKETKFEINNGKINEVNKLTAPIAGGTSSGSDSSDSDNDTSPSKPKPDKAIIKSFNKKPQLVDINGNVTGKSVEVTETSYPFSTMTPEKTTGKINLATYNQEYNDVDMPYAEKEYFLSGEANIYNIDDKEKAYIKNENVPYTNRIIVRMPENPEQFSGKVYVDILNASSGVDLEDLWRRSHDYILESGHAYVGITSKTTTIDALKKFNPERYDSLSWNNPYNQNNGENGLVWDIVAQTGTLLKENNGKSTLLYGAETKIPVTHTYLTGQSQSGWYINTFSNVFGEYNKLEETETPIYDGLMSIVGAMKAVEVNGTDKKAPKAKIKPSSVPVMSIVGEADVVVASRREDADEVNDKYRLYEVAGAPHSHGKSPIIPTDEEILKAGGKARDVGKYTKDKVTGKQHTLENFSFDVFITGALDNLDKWVSENIVPPKGEKIEVDENGKLQRDEYDNVKGGIRSPQIDVPVASYYGWINNGGFATEGSMTYFDEDQIAKRYAGGQEEYLEEFTEGVEKVYEEGWIIEADKEKLIDIAEREPVFTQKSADAEKITKAMHSIPMIINEKGEETGEAIEVDLESGNYPFSTMAADKIKEDIGFEESGYTEKEFFLKGNANIYGLATAELPFIRKEGVEYVNRIIVRMPENIEDFSGQVYVDILNASDKYDVESVWSRSYEHLIENGHAYVGITSKPLTVDALKKFNPERYDILSWATPGQINSGTELSFAGITNDTETGFAFDIISQTGALLRQENSPILYGNDSLDEELNIYLTGVSQSGWYLNTYINVFEKYTEDLFDGYLNATGLMGSGFPSMYLNQKEALSSVPAGGVRTKKPYIGVATEFDFHRGNMADPEGENTRIYELAGSAHSYKLSNAVPNDEEIIKSGLKPGTVAENVNAYPQHAMVSGMLQH